MINLRKLFNNFVIRFTIICKSTCCCDEKNVDVKESVKDR